MAERRMFAKTIVDSDSFLDMPLSAQALYFHLGMRADDDGFLNNPKKIQRIVNASDDDLKILIAKSFIIPFNSGVVVIKHWKINNQIKADRYKPTVYVEEKSLLTVKDNNSYSLDMEKEQNVSRMVPECIQNGSKVEPQYSIGKDSIGKNSIVEDRLDKERENTRTEPKRIFGEYKHVRLKETEYSKLVGEYGQQMTDDCITFLDEYIEMKGYKAKSHYLCIKKWVINAVNERKAKTSSGMTKPTNRVARELEESYDMMREWLEESKAKEVGGNGDGT